MARIKKVSRINRNINCGDNIERKFDKSLIDVNFLNSRKLCNNERNRRTLFSRSYHSSVLNNYVSIYPEIRKNLITKSTQTAAISKLQVGGKEATENCSTFTQTYDFPEGCETIGKNKDFVGGSKSDSFLLRNNIGRPEKSPLTSPKTIFKEGTYENSNNKTLIFLHQNKNMKSHRMSPPIVVRKKKIHSANNHRTQVMAKKLRLHQNKMSRKKLRNDKMKRRIKKRTLLVKSENFPLYHEFFQKMRQFYLAIKTEWPFKLAKIFSDLGISLTESITSLYKYYETQKYQSMDDMCQCQQKINQLATKLDALESNLHMSQTKFNYDLQEKIEELNRKLESYKFLEEELADLKKEIFKSTSSNEKPPGAPLPPPPPPLPLFTLSTNCTSKSFLNVVRNEKKIINYENPRPIITLEDILKVKLKKISVTNI